MSDTPTTISETPVRKAGRREWTGLAVIALPCLLYSMDLTVLNLAREGGQEVHVRTELTVRVQPLPVEIVAAAVAFPTLDAALATAVAIAQARCEAAAGAANVREALESVPFVVGYGVEMGLMLDIAAKYGLASIAQVELGTRHHRRRKLLALEPQALEVAMVALERAGIDVPDCVDIVRRGTHLGCVGVKTLPPPGGHHGGE